MNVEFFAFLKNLVWHTGIEDGGDCNNLVRIFPFGAIVLQLETVCLYKLQILLMIAAHALMDIM